MALLLWRVRRHSVMCSYMSAVGAGDGSVVVLETTQDQLSWPWAAESWSWVIRLVLVLMKAETKTEFLMIGVTQDHGHYSWLSEKNVTWRYFILWFVTFTYCELTPVFLSSQNQVLERRSMANILCRHTFYLLHPVMEKYLCVLGTRLQSKKCSEPEWDFHAPSLAGANYFQNLYSLSAIGVWRKCCRR